MIAELFQLRLPRNFPAAGSSNAARPGRAGQQGGAVVARLSLKEMLVAVAIGCMLAAVQTGYVLHAIHSVH